MSASASSTKAPKTAAELEAGRLQFEANKLTAETLGEWRLGDSQVVARVTVFGGKPGVDIREMFEGKDGNWYPSKSGKGIRLNEYKWNALLEALPAIRKTVEGFAGKPKPAVKPPAKPGKPAFAKTKPATAGKKRKIADDDQEDAEMQAELQANDADEADELASPKPKAQPKPKAKKVAVTAAGDE